MVGREPYGDIILSYDKPKFQINLEYVVGVCQRRIITTARKSIGKETNLYLLMERQIQSDISNFCFSTIDEIADKYYLSVAYLN